MTRGAADADLGDKAGTSRVKRLTDIDGRVDVLEYRRSENDDRAPERKMVRAGEGATVVVAHEAEAARRRRAVLATQVALAVGAVGIGWFLTTPTMAAVAGAVAAGVSLLWRPEFEAMVPGVVAEDVTPAEAAEKWDAIDPRTGDEP